MTGYLYFYTYTRGDVSSEYFTLLHPALVPLKYKSLAEQIFCVEQSEDGFEVFFIKNRYTQDTSTISSEDFCALKLRARALDLLTL